MARKVSAADFANAFEYNQAKKAERQKDRNKRVSATGRRSHQFTPAD